MKWSIRSSSIIMQTETFNFVGLNYCSQKSFSKCELKFPSGPVYICPKYNRNRNDHLVKVIRSKIFTAIRRPTLLFSTHFKYICTVWYKKTVYYVKPFYKNHLGLMLQTSQTSLNKNQSSNLFLSIYIPLQRKSHK